MTAYANIPTKDSRERRKKFVISLSLIILSRPLLNEVKKEKYLSLKYSYPPTMLISCRSFEFCTVLISLHAIRLFSELSTCQWKSFFIKYWSGKNLIMVVIMRIGIIKGKKERMIAPEIKTLTKFEMK